VDAKPVIIKKYENRRLYDTSASRYVNLDDVAQMVRDGVALQVVDANTGEDLTRVVLTQIIVEQAKTPDSALPLDILRQMVIASGRASQEGILRYMKAVFDMYQTAYRTFQPLAPFPMMPGMPAGPFPQPPAAPPEPASSSSAQNRSSESRTEERDLRARIDELESLVSKLSVAQRPRKKPRRAGGRQKS
jgi:polyhydroxyalkanoate synthesis repressor PhaR